MTFEEWWKDQGQYFEAANYLDATRMAKAAWEAAQPQWLPIEIAPKDTAVICCNELGNVGEACFISCISNPSWYWADDRMPIPEALNPTKWMPLPVPPKGERHPDIGTLGNGISVLESEVLPMRTIMVSSDLFYGSIDLPL